MEKELGDKEYARWCEVLGDTPLPASFVDLDAVDRNIETLLHTVRRSGKTLRIATKSLRCVELMRYIQRQGGAPVQGWMTYDASEMAFLADRGFDDLLLAYPTMQRQDAEALASLAARGAKVATVVDAVEHLDLLHQAAIKQATRIDVVIEVDMALRLGPAHLGVLRSPLRFIEDVVQLAEATRRFSGVRLAGLMGYEAQVAGLPDRNPIAPAQGAMQRMLKALSRQVIPERRARVVEELRRRGFDLRLVNGGGTGSIGWTASEPYLTEVTAGSGFVASHLFDHYDNLPLEPALFFALRVVRRPAPGVVTCAGGGYVASGAAGPEKLPKPWWPSGLALVKLEGAGEVQTPLRLPPGLSLSLGAPVLFRHAKAGELAEHFPQYYFVRGRSIEAVHPTYRGEGACFL
ncbi:MAG: alanine racemase [Myxococcales bacterium]|nr:alanine racemase [Polyangiaceae bacterium]MDW8250543.1 alanine racemase [Myxococcales bacterium]